MNILTATRGDQPGDFSWTVEGEIVTSPWQICDRPDCGCERSFTGLASHCATTTARVSDMPITRDELVDLIVDHLRQAGWHELADGHDVVQAILDTTTAMADTFATGSVIHLVTPSIAVARTGEVDDYQPGDDGF